MREFNPWIFCPPNKEVFTDAWSAFWSENTFRFAIASDPTCKLSSLGTPIIWSSLRYLQVFLLLGDDLTRDVDRLSGWRQVCIDLGAHSPPSRLTLDLTVFVLDSVQTASLTGDALHSMKALPVLRGLSIKIYPAILRGIGIHRMATHTVKRLTCPSIERRSPFRFMDLPVEIQFKILGYTDLVAPGPIIPNIFKGYALDNCWGGGDRYEGTEYCECFYSAGYDSSKSCCWSLPADLFLVSRHISAMSSEIFFSRNEFIVGVADEPSYPNDWPAPLIWTPTDSGCDPSPRPEVWYPEHSYFLRSFPPAYIPMLKFLTWRVTLHEVILSEKLAADWIRAIEFIAQNVKPLSKLTITLDMRSSQLCDKAMEPLQKLRGLGGLFVRLSGNRDQSIGVAAAEELRLERLVMGEGYRRTQGELEAHGTPYY
jgi:hypothetical protein